MVEMEWITEREAASCAATKGGEYLPGLNTIE
jgi:hypothetical protein